MTDGVTPRFVACVQALRTAGIPMLTISSKTGIDRRNLLRLTGDTTGRHAVPAAWLEALCQAYPHVSPAYLLTGTGGPLLV